MLFKEISDIFKHPGDSRDWKSWHVSMHSTWFLDKEKYLFTSHWVSKMGYKFPDLLLRKVINVIVSCYGSRCFENLMSCYEHRPFLKNKERK